MLCFHMTKSKKKSQKLKMEIHYLIQPNIKQTIRFTTWSKVTKLFSIIFPLFSPLPDFIGTAQESGLDVGKNVKMTVSANQSCPFGYFSRHRTQTTVNRRGMK